MGWGKYNLKDSQSHAKLNKRYLNYRNTTTGMGKVIEVVYENGVFKPLKEVSLKEGEKLRIEIKESLVDKLKKYRIKVDTDVLEEFLEERR